MGWEAESGQHRGTAMNVCLSCFQAQAGGPYCGGCGRTFGVKLCEGRHASPPSSRIRCCPACGSTQLTEPTLYLNLTWLPLFLAGLAALGVWRWGIAHLPLLGGLLVRLALTVLAVLLGTTPCQIIGGLHVLLSWLLMLWLLGWAIALLPGKGGTVGGWLRRLPDTVLKTVRYGGMALLRLVGQSVRRLVLPPSHKPPGDPHRKK